MRNIVIGIIIIGLSCLGFWAIKELLVPAEQNVEYPPATSDLPEELSGLETIDTASNYTSYLLHDAKNTEFTFYLSDNAFTYHDNNFYINDKEVLKGVVIHPSLALYTQRLLVIAFDFTNEKYGGILFADLETLENEVVTQIDDYYIMHTQELIFNNTSLTFNVSLVNAKQIFLNGKWHDICKMAYSPDAIVLKMVEQRYDNYEKKFTTIETISSLSFESYKIVNKYC